MLKAAKGGYQSPADVNSQHFVPEVISGKEGNRGVSVERQNMSFNNIQSRSESVNKPRDTSENRIVADRRREDSSTPNRGERDKKIPKDEYRRDPIGKPSSDFVAKTHLKIENKTKKPNIARLNNTTIDDASQIYNRLKSPGVSVSPGPKREQESTHKATTAASTNFDSSCTYRVNSSKHQQEDPPQQDKRDQ